MKAWVTVLAAVTLISTAAQASNILNCKGQSLELRLEKNGGTSKLAYCFNVRWCASNPIINVRAEGADSQLTYFTDNYVSLTLDDKEGDHFDFFGLAVPVKCVNRSMPKDVDA